MPGVSSFTKNCDVLFVRQVTVVF